MPSVITDKKTGTKVRFFFEDKKFALKNRTLLKAFIEFLFKKEKKQLSSINYIFCSDKMILDINSRFLNHANFTDIITFDLSETNSTVAEIYISIDRVKENAKKFGYSFESELHRVIFHGALHLCGYKDKNKIVRKEMRGKEDYYLSLYL